MDVGRLRGSAAGGRGAVNEGGGRGCEPLCLTRAAGSAQRGGLPLTIVTDQFCTVGGGGCGGVN